MLLDLTEIELLDFVVGDFEAAWDALASTPEPKHRGNFLFARHAFVLLEVVCRLCKSDAKGHALQDFSAALYRREPRYFTALPAPCRKPSSRARPDFALPSQGDNPDNQVIAALFNLIRNGQAHQYQQMGALLTDGKQLRISLIGVRPGAFLGTVFSNGRPPEHLRVERDDDRNLWMTVRPDVVFVDVRDSIRDVDLLSRGLTFSFMEERSPRTFDFNSAAAEEVLRRQGHWV
jgi:hypothetical protein